MNRVLTAALVCLCLPAQAIASPRIAVHVEPAPDQCGSGWLAPTPCSGLVSAIRDERLGTDDGQGGTVGAFYRIYVLAEQLDLGINAIGFGIAYDPGALTMYGFCFPTPSDGRTQQTSETWPRSASGIHFQWPACQGNAVPGHENEGKQVSLVSFYVYVHASTRFYVTPHPGDRNVLMTDCQWNTIVLPDSASGRAGFGTDPGFNPCTGEGVWTPAPGSLPPPPPPPPPSPAAVLLHVSNTTDPAESCGVEFPQSNVVTTGSLNPSDNPHVVYLLAVPEGASAPYSSVGITGVQLGIQYPARPEVHKGVKVLSWQTCSDLEFPSDDWPGPGSSNTITWAIDNCELGDLLAVGYFTVSAYDPSTMSIIPFPPSGLIKVATCRGAEAVAETFVPPERAGWISLGGGAIGTDTNGCNPLLEPCSGGTPVHATTWGKIKTLFGHP